MENFSKYLSELKLNSKNKSEMYSVSATTPSTLDFWNPRLKSTIINLNESSYGDFLVNSAEKVSNLYKLNNDYQVGFSVGASQVYFQAIASLTNKGDTVIIESPTYEPLKAALKFFDLNVIEINILDPDLTTNIKKMYSKYNPKIFVFTSPNMPTGKIISPEVIKVLQNLSCSVIVDECYLPLFSNSWSVFDSFENIISISNSSKTTGLSSLRVGWYLTEIKDFKENFDKIGTLLHVDIPTIPIDIFVNKVINEIPNLQDYFKALTKKNYTLIRDKKTLLNHQIYSSYESGGYFTSLKFDSDKLNVITESLIQNNILIQKTDIFGLNDGIRLSLNSCSEKFKKAIKIISDNL